MAGFLLGLEIDGPPKGKARPRFRVIGSGQKQFVSTYTDSDTRKYEDRLKSAAIDAMGMREPFSDPLSVKVEAFMPIPSSWSLRKQAQASEGLIMPASGIDLDNIVKMLDGLNYHPPRFKGDREKRPIVWMNDSQIVSLMAVKRYSLTPLLRIGVWKWFD